MGYSENTRGANGSGSGVVWTILFLCAGIALVMALQQARADRGNPAPSPTVSHASVTVAGTLMGEDRWSWGIGSRP